MFYNFINITAAGVFVVILSGCMLLNLKHLKSFAGVYRALRLNFFICLSVSLAYLINTLSNIEHPKQIGLALGVSLNLVLYAALAMTISLLLVENKKKLV